MRRFLLFSTLITFTLATLTMCSGLALAATSPFRPGDALFPIQQFAEEQRAALLFSNTGKAVYFFNLADRRVDDLIQRSGTNNELVALLAMDDALDRAELAAATVPVDDLPVLVDRLADVLLHAKSALAMLTIAPQQDPQAYAHIQAQVATLNSLVNETRLGRQRALAKTRFILNLPLVASTGNPLPNPASATGMIDPRLINFPPGSPGAEHAFFPLIGAHGSIECESCHVGGQFAGTPKACVACHAMDEPANHFAGDCASCHVPTRWQDAIFDHAAAGATDCRACHNKDKPANHYSGQCSACHNTSSWKNAKFNHKVAGATDCQACHNKDKPANHFTGQCSNCHTTNSWKGAKFDHTGLTDCISCHSKNKPANHFSGQCSNCHTTSSWKGAKFDHTGKTDCQSCHNRPSNHYSGQCSNCHTTSSWKGAKFDHSGQTDCQSCHKRPNNHYSGQCSNCHNTNSWGNVSFNHSGQTDCQSCHKRPNNHYSGQCSNCHNTNSWGNASLSGHKFPLNHKGANGQCSKCHPSDPPAYTCYNCHDKGKEESKHAEKGITDIGSRCAKCHPNGKSD